MWTHCPYLCAAYLSRSLVDKSPHQGARVVSVRRQVVFVVAFVFVVFVVGDGDADVRQPVEGESDCGACERFGDPRGLIGCFNVCAE